MYLDSV